MIGPDGHTGDQPVDLWARFWSEVDNHDWLAARDLMVVSGRVSGFFALFVDWDEYRELQLDWDAAAAASRAEGFSSTEARLVDLCLALTRVTPGPSLTVHTLTNMGSWSEHVWQVLTEWGSDGRLTTTRTCAGDVAARAMARLHRAGGTS